MSYKRDISKSVLISIYITLCKLRNAETCKGLLNSTAGWPSG